MVFELTHRLRDGEPTYRLTDEAAETQFEAALALSYAGLAVHILKDGAPYCMLDFVRPAGSRIKPSLARPMPARIIDSLGQSAGSIGACARRPGCFRCEISELHYEFYVSGSDKRRIRAAVWQGEELIAAFEEAAPAGGSFAVYAESRAAAEEAAFMAIFCDINHYLPFGEYDVADRPAHLRQGAGKALAGRFEPLPRFMRRCAGEPEPHDEAAAPPEEDRPAAEETAPEAPAQPAPAQSPDRDSVPAGSAR